MTSYIMYYSLQANCYTHLLVGDMSIHCHLVLRKQVSPACQLFSWQVRLCCLLFKLENTSVPAEHILYLRLGASEWTNFLCLCNQLIYFHVIVDFWCSNNDLFVPTGLSVTMWLQIKRSTGPIMQWHCSCHQFHIRSAFRFQDGS